MQSTVNRRARWWPARYVEGQATELWLVTEDRQLLATAPLGMFPTNVDILVR